MKFIVVYFYAKEIKFALGVQKADLVQRIIRAIDELPDTSVPLGVPVRTTKVDFKNK